MVTMYTIILVFLFIVLAVPLGLATLGFLCQEQGEAIDPEWGIHQQRQGGFPQQKPPQAWSRLARVPSRTAGARSADQRMPGRRGAAPC